MVQLGRLEPPTSCSAFLRFWILLLSDPQFPDGGAIDIGEAMSKPRDGRQKGLLLPALDQVIDIAHPLVQLGGADRLEHAEW